VAEVLAAQAVQAKAPTVLIPYSQILRLLQAEVVVITTTLVMLVALVVVAHQLIHRALLR